MRRHIDGHLQLGAAQQHLGRDNDSRVVAVGLLTITGPGSAWFGAQDWVHQRHTG
jgi:hypothetical protein